MTFEEWYTEEGFHYQRLEVVLMKQAWDAALLTQPEATFTRDAILDEAAEAVLQRWKTAPNSPPLYEQNTISHGCIAAAAVIRALKGKGPQG